MLIRGAPQVAQVQMVGDNPSKPLAPPDEPGPGRGQAGSVSQERSKALGTGATQADSRQTGEETAPAAVQGSGLPTTQARLNKLFDYPDRARGEGGSIRTPWSA